MNLEDVRAFVAIAEAGSLSGGARRLGLSVATAGRRIDALERAVGVPLLRRGKTGVSLSEAGRKLLATARPAIDRLGDVERVGAALKAGRAAPAIRISATEPIIAQVLAPALPKLLEQAEVVVELLTATAVANFDRHECDIAVRLFRPTGDTLVARRMPDIALGLFAAPDYLAGRDPASLILGDERLLMISDSYGRIAEVEWVARHGFEDATIVKSSSSLGLLQAARAGTGIALAPCFLAQGLVAIPAPPIPARQCWLVSHADTKHSPATPSGEELGGRRAQSRDPDGRFALTTAWSMRRRAG